MVDKLTIQDIDFLPKMKFQDSKPIFVKEKTMKIWVNNFLINLTENISFSEFSVKISPSIGRENLFMKEKIFKYLNLKRVFGLHLFTGDAVFIKNKKDFTFENIYTFHVKLGETEYEVLLQNTQKSFQLSSNYTSTKEIQVKKMLYELIMKEIIKANPNVEQDRQAFILPNQKEVLVNNNEKINFIPGFTTSIHSLMGKIYINISLKNRFLQEKNCYVLIEEMKKAKISNKEISDTFMERIIKTTYSKKNYRILNVNFEKTAKKEKFISSNGKELTLVEYYKIAHGVTISDPNQVLFETKIRDCTEEKTIYLIPELCLLTGIEDSMIANRNFMTELASKTKHTPDEKVRKIKEFFKILNSDTQKKYIDKDKKSISLPSSVQLKKEFGVEIEQNKGNEVKGYLIKDPIFMSNGTTLSKLDRQKVHINKVQGKVLIVYHQNDYDNADNLPKLFGKAGKDLNIKPPEVEYIEVSSKRAEDYIKAIKSPELFQIVIFIIPKFSEKRLYSQIKKHSLVEKGYLSQCIKSENISNPKKSMSVATKLLLQINQKLGGASYITKSVTGLENRKLMIVGVDSSHIQGRRTGVAMVASINNDFTNYFNKEIIIEEKNKEQICFTVGKFIIEAINEYFILNKSVPSDIIIYRQGVSKEQKEFLKSEILNIENCISGNLSSSSFLRGNTIKYAYIIVNKKNSFKFFDNNKQFSNPEGGLVILDGATSGDYLEFFLQPQEVTQGTATPTHFHVAFGSMNEKDYQLVIQLTYNLCYIYPNWPGPVRVPMVMKLAEKLALMISKNIKSEAHESLNKKLYYL